jgi:NAD(P)-dependent dehydrogenase (short-subunit alcohol dehydrogenase family)
MQEKPVALVTGANQGIGLQIAKDLVTHGFTVLVGSRDFERGAAAARKVGPDAHALQLDVTDQASVDAAAERIGNAFGRLDVLIQNAAISNTGTQSDGIKVNAVSPGFTKTDLNGFAGTETVEEGAREAVRVALIGPDGPTGQFTHATLGVLPW